MKIGIVMNTYLYNQKRLAVVEQTYASLMKTMYVREKPKLLIVERKTFPFWMPDFRQVFDFEYQEDPPGVGGPDTPLCWGSERLFSQGVDYVTWLNDDAAFNPEWLMRLGLLIDRHPDAIAWSVYHSNHTIVHAELERKNGDVRVSSLCGIGLTMSKKEFEAWGVKSAINKDWTSPYGCTIDLHHVWQRPGERWVTEKSYIQHTGTAIGMHLGVGQMHPESAKNFVGEN